MLKSAMADIHKSQQIDKDSAESFRLVNRAVETLETLRQHYPHSSVCESVYNDGWAVGSMSLADIYTEACQLEDHLEFARALAQEAVYYPGCRMPNEQLIFISLIRDGYYQQAEQWTRRPDNGKDRVDSFRTELYKFYMRNNMKSKGDSLRSIPEADKNFYYLCEQARFRSFGLGPEKTLHYLSEAAELLLEPDLYRGTEYFEKLIQLTSIYEDQPDMARPASIPGLIDTHYRLCMSDHRVAENQQDYKSVLSLLRTGQACYIMKDTLRAASCWDRADSEVINIDHEPLWRAMSRIYTECSQQDRLRRIIEQLSIEHARPGSMAWAFLEADSTLLELYSWNDAHEHDLFKKNLIISAHALSGGDRQRAVDMLDNTSIVKGRRKWGPALDYASLAMRYSAAGALGSTLDFVEKSIEQLLKEQKAVRGRKHISRDAWLQYSADVMGQLSKASVYLTIPVSYKARYNFLKIFDEKHRYEQKQINSLGPGTGVKDE